MQVQVAANLDHFDKDFFTQMLRTNSSPFLLFFQKQKQQNPCMHRIFNLKCHPGVPYLKSAWDMNQMSTKKHSLGPLVLQMSYIEKMFWIKTLPTPLQPVWKAFWCTQIMERVNTKFYTQESSQREVTGWG